ncbi:MAG: 8-amino-7-oxononanoate synthase [Vampirovibrio sp.]|nr:8-amino-7-oxononanoate synthase [Vampirovibrio sp.]
MEQTVHKTSLTDIYRERLSVLQAQQRLRECQNVSGAEFPLISINGQLAIHFCSNNYLGLAIDPRMKQAALEAIENSGTSASASRLVSGTDARIIQLEESIADWKGTEAALVFNSGYQANLGIIQALTGPGDWIFADRLNHASLVDGCRLSGAKLVRYHHKDVNHLEDKLKTAPVNALKWIITDSVFSMDGTRAPLEALVDLSEKYGAMLMVDEAHANGILGDKKHSGLVEHLRLIGCVHLQTGGFGKALGSQGGYAAGSRVLIDTLINKARSFIYSTALPPSVIAANKKALEVVQSESSLNERLWQNIHLMHTGLCDILSSANLPESPASGIFPVIIGDSAKTLVVCDDLLSRGFFVKAIRPPTVPEGTARLRITLSAAHTQSQIQSLLLALKDCIATTSS